MLVEILTREPVRVPLGPPMTATNRPKVRIELMQDQKRVSKPITAGNIDGLLINYIAPRDVSMILRETYPEARYINKIMLGEGPECLFSVVGEDQVNDPRFELPINTRYRRAPEYIGNLGAK